MIARATVTVPEIIGLLVWWSVVLAAPVVWLRRRRRTRGAEHRSRWRNIQSRNSREGRRLVDGERSMTTGPSDPTATKEATRPRETADDSPECSRPVASFTAAQPSGSGARSPRPSMPTLDSGTLEPLCRYVDFQRRLELAASELRVRLARLPAGGWRVEPYPLTGERRNTVMVLGETGVFVVSATYAPGHWDDVLAVSRLARKLQALLPGYGGQVQPAICHPFSATEPRIWHRADEHGDWVGAWLVGGDSVVNWFMHFGPEHGLNAADLTRFDELAKSNWLKAAIPTAPSWPQINEAPSAGAHE